MLIVPLLLQATFSPWCCINQIQGFSHNITVTVCNVSDNDIAISAPQDFMSVVRNGSGSEQIGDVPANKCQQELVPVSLLGPGTLEMDFSTVAAPRRSATLKTNYGHGSITIYVANNKRNCPTSAKNRECKILKP